MGKVTIEALLTESQPEVVTCLLSDLAVRYHRDWEQLRRSGLDRDCRPIVVLMLEMVDVEGNGHTRSAYSAEQVHMAREALLEYLSAA